MIYPKEVYIALLALQSVKARQVLMQYCRGTFSPVEMIKKIAKAESMDSIHTTLSKYTKLKFQKERVFEELANQINERFKPEAYDNILTREHLWKLVDVDNTIILQKLAKCLEVNQYSKVLDLIFLASKVSQSFSRVLKSNSISYNKSILNLLHHEGFKLGGINKLISNSGGNNNFKDIIKKEKWISDFAKVKFKQKFQCNENEIPSVIANIIDKKIDISFSNHGQTSKDDSIQERLDWIDRIKEDTNNPINDIEKKKKKDREEDDWKTSIEKLSALEDAIEADSFDSVAINFLESRLDLIISQLLEHANNTVLESTNANKENLYTLHIAKLVLELYGQGMVNKVIPQLLRMNNRRIKISDLVTSKNFNILPVAIKELNNNRPLIIKDVEAFESEGTSIFSFIKKKKRQEKFVVHYPTTSEDSKPFIEFFGIDESLSKFLQSEIKELRVKDFNISEVIVNNPAFSLGELLVNTMIYQPELGAVRKKEYFRYAVENLGPLFTQCLILSGASIELPQLSLTENITRKQIFPSLELEKEFVPIGSQSDLVIEARKKSPNQLTVIEGYNFNSEDYE